MSQLTLRLKPNDQVTLKDNFVNYCLNNTDNIKPNSPSKFGCKDPNYVLDMCDARLFQGSTVVIENVERTHPYYKKFGCIVTCYYLHVRDRVGNRGVFPIEFVNRRYSLVRNHRRTTIYNKILICE